MFYGSSWLRESLPRRGSERGEVDFLHKVTQTLEPPENNDSRVSIGLVLWSLSRLYSPAARIIAVGTVRDLPRIFLHL